MKIKRYFAPDIRRAIRMVREEQGQEAVILSNRQIEGGGGLGAEISRELVREIPLDMAFDQAWLKVIAILVERIAVTDDDILTQGGVVALLGATGGGKTTTIAKLAARNTLGHGKNSVALISTDNFRVGAHEQLRIYGRILGAPVLVATSPPELQDATGR